MDTWVDTQKDTGGRMIFKKPSKAMYFSFNVKYWQGLENCGQEYISDR